MLETYKHIFFNAYNDAPPEEVHRQFRVKSGELIMHIQTTLKNRIKQNYDEQTIYEIGGRHIRFLQELETSFEAPIERLAWCSRNVFELFLWLSYVTTSETNAKAFIGYVVLDTQEILEGFSNYYSAKDSPQIKKQYESQRERYINFAQEKGTTIPLGQLKTKGLARLAHTRFSKRDKQLNIMVDLEGFYRLSSKFVHPSPYFISGAITDRTKAINRHVMLYKVLEYSEAMLDLYRERIGETETQSSEDDNHQDSNLKGLKEKAWAELSNGKFGEFSKYAHKWHKETNTPTTSPDGPFFPVIKIATDKTKP